MSMMTKTIAGSALFALALAAGAQAQTPAPPAAPVQGAPGDKAADGATATEWTYRMKDGGLYQPPAERPVSPAQDYTVYNRT